MSNVVELFGKAHDSKSVDWRSTIAGQRCPFADKACYKTRKSDSSISIGTCTVLYGQPPEPVIICPTRLIEHGQIFADCLHLLTAHEPGNDLHIVREVSILGGRVDYVLVSMRDNKVKDFVGIELQTLDTTGSVWPARQRLLKELGVERLHTGEDLDTTYGMNWKMTAKTILVQMHHKAQTFEHVNKKLVLVIQDKLLAYMTREFKFDHLKNPAAPGDSVHVHAYKMGRDGTGDLRLSIASRLSTDADGIGTCLGSRAEAPFEMDQIIGTLQKKIASGNGQSARFLPPTKPAVSD
jgi:hypothetical protein